MTKLVEATNGHFLMEVENEILLASGKTVPSLNAILYMKT